MSEISRNVIFSEKKSPCGNANLLQKAWAGWVGVWVGVVSGVLEYRVQGER